MLGWVAEREPGLVREIQRRGHEVACHGHGHQRLDVLGPASAREDIFKSKALLEDLTGSAVLGYRAPTYSVRRDTLWALDILVEAGFRYDSSIFPIHHDVYGIPDAPRFPHVVRRPAGEIVEFPLSTLDLGFGPRKVRIPVAGGGYLRLLPAAFVRWAHRRINRVESQPAVLYFHPWEIDPGQPRIRAGWRSGFRHYVNLDRTVDKIRALLLGADYSTMASVLTARGLAARGPEERQSG